MTAILATQRTPWSKSHATDITATTFTLRAPVKTFNSTTPVRTPQAEDGFIPWAWHGGESPNMLHLIPYGTAAATKTGTVRVWGWTLFPRGASKYDLWIPELLFEATLALSTKAGVDDTPISSSYLFADTMAIGTGFATNVSYEIVSPTSNAIAHAHFDAKGVDFLEVDLACNGANGAASLNTVWRSY